MLFVSVVGLSSVVSGVASGCFDFAFVFVFVFEVLVVLEFFFLLRWGLANDTTGISTDRSNTKINKIILHWQY